MARLSTRDAVEVTLYVLVALVGGFLLAVTLEVAYAVALVTGGSGFEDALTGTLAAGGVIEPLATKFVPALFVAYTARTQVPAAAGLLERRWLAAGVGLGLAVGLMEFLSKLPLLASDRGSLVLVGCALAPALLLHPLVGALVAAPTFRAAASEPLTRARRLTLAVLAVGIVAAMAVHVWWNTGGGATVAGAISPQCDLTLSP